MSETKVILTIMFFFAFLGFMSAILPPPLRILSPFDFLWFGGGIIGVGAACGIVTGLGCTVALGIFGVVSLVAYLVVFVSWIKLLIFMPITIIIVYLISRLARGGG
jgi:hypothetical protein